APVSAGGGGKRLLYVAVPGIRNYVEWGGIGVLVYDIDHGHRLVKRISTFEAKPAGEPEGGKGVCACGQTGKVYVSTDAGLGCFDLVTERKVWEKQYEGGCDRMSITPDGKTLYVPSLEGPHWHAVAADTGDVLAKIVPNSGSHNTVCGLSGEWAYLAGL